MTTTTAPRENISANPFGVQCVNAFDKDGRFVKQVLCFGSEAKARLKARLELIDPSDAEYESIRRAYLAA